MRKTKLLAGQYNVYVVFDKISKHYKAMYYASNDEDFIRLYLPSIILTIPLRELNIFKIGVFNDVTGALKPTIKKRVDVNCYLFPHSKLSPIGENLSHEEIEKEILETKNKIIASADEVREEQKAEEEKIKEA